MTRKDIKVLKEIYKEGIKELQGEIKNKKRELKEAKLKLKNLKKGII